MNLHEIYRVSSLTSSFLRKECSKSSCLITQTLPISLMFNLANPLAAHTPLINLFSRSFYILHRAFCNTEKVYH